MDATFDHAGLAVADLPAMQDWYAATLGLVVDFRFELAHVPLAGVMLLCPRGGYRIELLHRPDTRPGIQADNPGDAARVQGFGHLALDVPDVDAAYERLLRAGAGERMSPRPSPEPGVRMAFVADPEGNLIELLDRTAARAAHTRRQ